MADARSYVSGNFHFDLDGVKCGFIKSIEGGDIQAEVINEALGPDYFVHKHIGKPKYNDITMSVGFSMTKPIFEWIKASWQGNYQRKKGAITACNHKLEAMNVREFYEALVTETTIPAMDGGSKEPAYMTLKFAPEWIRFKKGDNKKVTGETGKGEQKAWLPSNFRLEIPGLDCKKVNKFDAFTVKQSAVEDAVGDTRDQAKEPGKLEFPNIKITLSETTVETWQAWHEDFVVRGNNSQDKEKTGSLIFLSSNREKELGRVNFFNLGIFKLSPEKSEANADQIKRVTAELYCERMELTYGDQVIG
jgi:phage tail-like protein